MRDEGKEEERGKKGMGEVWSFFGFVAHDLW